MTLSPRADRSATVKANIRRAAGQLFAQNGFVATGIREIADEAGVDKSIVIRHFGSKENLFIETMSLPTEWVDMMAGSLDDLPLRLLRLILSDENGTGKGVFAAMIRASDSQEVRSQLRKGLQETVAAPLAARLGTPDADIRGHLFVAALVGLLTTIWVVDDTIVGGLAPDEIARNYAPALQALLVAAG